MKKIFCFTLCSVLASLLLSCSNKSGSHSGDTSIAKASGADTVPSHETYLNKFIFFTEKSPMKVAEIRQLHQDYLDNPLPLMSPEDSTKKLRGFIVPGGDIEALRKKMGNDFNGLRIYFGYDKAKKQFRLLLVGVKKDGSNLLEDYYVFDDFKPCPNECPENLPTLLIQRTDLNYNPATGTHHHLQ